MKGERKEVQPERRNKWSGQKNMRKIRRALCHGSREFQRRNYQDQMQNICPRDDYQKMAIRSGDLEIIDDRL